MDSYATIKTMLSRVVGPVPLKLLVNFAASQVVAADVHRRIDQSCRRFLGIALELGISLPTDSGPPLAPRSLMPRGPSAAQSPFAAAIEQLAAGLGLDPTALPPQRAAA
jgi:hypothetical protein